MYIAYILKRQDLLYLLYNYPLWPYFKVHVDPLQISFTKMNQIINKIVFFFLGAVIGGGLIFGVTQLTEKNDSGSSNQNTTGTRANESLRFVSVVSWLFFI